MRRWRDEEPEAAGLKVGMGTLWTAMTAMLDAAQAAQRAADAGGLEARAQAVQDSNRTARGGVRGEAVWAAAILREEAKAIRASGPPAAEPTGGQWPN